MFGIERVNFFGRFNIFYGLDFGPYYNYSKFGYALYEYNNGNTNYYNYSLNNPNGNYAFGPSESNKFGFAVSPFIGAKYRISERFSASIESSFFLSYFYSFNKIYAAPYYSGNSTSFNAIEFNHVAAKTTINGIQFNMNYLRFLTFNYHFN